MSNEKSRGKITIEFFDKQDPNIEFLGNIDVTDIPKIRYFLNMAYQQKYVDPARDAELKNLTIRRAELEVIRVKELAIRKEQELKKAAADKLQREKANIVIEADKAKIIKENRIVEAKRILAKVNATKQTAEDIAWATELLKKEQTNGTATGKSGTAEAAKPATK